MHNAIVNVNGQIKNAQEASISVFDRGFLYGDSLYEVARSYGGRLAFLGDHLERLEKSARLCHMELGRPASFYAREMERAVEVYRSQPGCGSTEVYCRIIVTRGVGRIGFSKKAVASQPGYVVIAQAVEAPSEEQLAKGLSLRVVDRLRNDRRAQDPAAKTGNYLNSVLSFLESEEAGFQDALMCNADGHVTEGTTFNIGYVKRGIVVTPPLDIGVLEGITRKHLLAGARARGIEVREVRFPKERLYEADEVFATGTVKEVFPVSRVDERKIALGPVVRRLQTIYREVLANA